MKHHHSSQSMIVVKNDMQWVGDTRLGGFGVYVDGRHAGGSFPETDLKVSVAPGRHTVRVRRLWFFSPRVTVDVPGEGAHVHLRADVPSTVPVVFRILKGMVWPLRSLVLEETGSPHPGE
jgi:hypothetical protein